MPTGFHVNTDWSPNLHIFIARSSQYSHLTGCAVAPALC